jgi:hypothetical protein
MKQAKQRKVRWHNVGMLGMNYFSRIQNVCEDKLYREVVNKFFEKVIDKLLEGETFVMPQRLGSVTVVKNKKVPKYIYNQGLSHIHKTDVYCTTMDVDKPVYKYSWNTKDALFKNQRIWKFFTMQSGKKKLFEKLLNGDAYFFRKKIL